MDENSTWSPTWRTMDKVSWPPRIYIRPTFKRWAWHKFRETMIFFNYFFQQQIFQDKKHNIFHNRFQDRQTPTSDSLELIKFGTYYNKPTPLLFFRQQNMQWSCNMIHSHFTLCLKAGEYIKRLSRHSLYSLWTRVKGPPPLQGHGSWLMCEVALNL